MQKGNLRHRTLRGSGRPRGPRPGGCARADHGRLTEALEAARFAVWDWNIAKGTVQCSGKLAEIFGIRADSCPSAEELLSRVHPEDREKVRLPTKDGPFSIDYRVTLPGGRQRWVSSRGLIYTDASGRPVRRLAAIFDVTDLHMAQQTAEQLKSRADQLADQRTAKLEDAVRQLESFSFSVSHDIRAPLRAMINYAELAQRACYGKVDQKTLSYLEKVVSAASRLEKLTHDLLRYSRLAKAPPSVLPMTIGPIIAELVEEYPALEAAKASIHFADVRGLVLANESMMRQVLSNILENAVRFRDPGRPLSVRVWTQEHGSRRRLFVQDNGIGIDPRYQSRIFLPFERLHPGETGTGMGLAIAKRAVELMGGCVGFESALGLGSTFWIELPKG